MVMTTSSPLVHVKEEAPFSRRLEQPAPRPVPRQDMGTNRIHMATHATQAARTRFVLARFRDSHGPLLQNHGITFPSVCPHLDSREAVRDPVGFSSPPRRARGGARCRRSPAPLRGPSPDPRADSCGSERLAMARRRPGALLLVLALAAVLSAARRADALSVTVTDTECIHEFVPYEGDTVSGNFVVVDHDIFWSSDHPGIDLTVPTPIRSPPWDPLMRG